MAGEARDFAGRLTILLNNTITHGITLAAVEPSVVGRRLFLVACGISRRDRAPQIIPVTLGKKDPTVFFKAAYRLGSDDQGNFLTVEESNLGLFLDREATQLFAHWDYNRAPANNYPAAHLQVAGNSHVIAKICELARDRLQLQCPDRELRDAHFPVGGRRYRPTLEDVIEFLLTEQLVGGHPRADEEFSDSRANWETNQLRAAVRRNPRTAIAQLEVDGYVVSGGPS